MCYHRNQKLTWHTAAFTLTRQLESVGIRSRKTSYWLLEGVGIRLAFRPIPTRTLTEHDGWRLWASNPQRKTSDWHCRKRIVTLTNFIHHRITPATTLETKCAWSPHTSVRNPSLKVRQSHYLEQILARLTLKRGKALREDGQRWQRAFFRRCQWAV